MEAVQHTSSRDVFTCADEDAMAMMAVAEVRCMPTLIHAHARAHAHTTAHMNMMKNHLYYMSECGISNKPFDPVIDVIYVLRDLSDHDIMSMLLMHVCACWSHAHVRMFSLTRPRVEPSSQSVCLFRSPNPASDFPTSPFHYDAICALLLHMPCNAEQHITMARCISAPRQTCAARWKRHAHAAHAR